MLDHSSPSTSSLLKVTPNKKILEGLSTIQSWELTARLDHTSGGSIPKKVTLTCLATSYSLVCTSSTQRFQLNAGFVLYSTLLIIVFWYKKKKKSVSTTKYILPPLGGGSVIIWINWSSRCYSKRKWPVEIPANDACLIWFNLSQYALVHFSFRKF